MASQCACELMSWWDPHIVMDVKTQIGPQEGQEQEGVLLALCSTIKDVKTPKEKSLREIKKRSMVPTLVVCLRA